MRKFETYLPVFTGFYNTIFEASGEENEIDDINNHRTEKNLPEIGYDECEWDYQEYRNEVSEQCTDQIEKQRRELLNDSVRVKFQKLISPREYNFANDSINIEISLNKDAQETILEILRDNSEQFSSFIRERYTSCSGFISSHSNDANEWYQILSQWNSNELSHKLGAVLGFILEEVEEYTEGDLYEAIERRSVYASNYNELIGDE